MEDETLKRIESKIDIQTERLTRIEITQGKQHVALEEHIRRTDQNEQSIKDVKEKDIVPLKRHVDMMNGALKLVGGLAVLATMAGGLAELLTYLRH